MAKVTPPLQAADNLPASMAALDHALDDFEESVEATAFDPLPPGHQRPARRWWGHHLGELRWQAELARLLIDPVYRGVRVPRATAPRSC